MTRLGLKTARRDLLALVRAVERDGERIVLTRRGRPVAALLPVGALDALDLLGRLLPTAEEVAAGLLPQQDEPAAPPRPGRSAVTALDPDRNAWVGHPEARPCRKALARVFSRDPLDGDPIGPFLDRLAARRGVWAVRSALSAWLSEPVLSGDPDGRQD